MNEAASEADFEVQLRAEGYTEVEIKEYAPEPLMVGIGITSRSRALCCLARLLFSRAMIQ